MTDRELLELAAKAAGIELHHWWAAGNAYMFCEHGGDPCGSWNPLTDDGDAFRLAVNRRFTIKDFAPHDNPEFAQIPPDAALWGMVEIWREDDNDPLHVEWYKAGADREAVTRRAIVRAAALEVRGTAEPYTGEPK